MAAEPLLPCRVIYPQVMEIRMWTPCGEGVMAIILPPKLSPGPHIHLSMVTVHLSFLALLGFSPFLPYFPHLSLSEVLVYDCVLFILVPLILSTVLGTS